MGYFSCVVPPQCVATYGAGDLMGHRSCPCAVTGAPDTAYWQREASTRVRCTADGVYSDRANTTALTNRSLSGS